MKSIIKSFLILLSITSIWTLPTPISYSSKVVELIEQVKVRLLNGSDIFPPFPDLYKHPGPYHSLLIIRGLNEFELTILDTDQIKRSVNFKIEYNNIEETYDLKTVIFDCDSFETVLQNDCRLHKDEISQMGNIITSIQNLTLTGHFAFTTDGKLSDGSIYVSGSPKITIKDENKLANKFQIFIVNEIKKETEKGLSRKSEIATVVDPLKKPFRRKPRYSYDEYWTFYREEQIQPNGQITDKPQFHEYDSSDFDVIA